MHVLQPLHRAELYLLCWVLGVNSCESKCSPPDAPVINGSTVDEAAAERFIQQAMELILDEAVKKGTNVKGKVKTQSSCSSARCHRALCMALIAPINFISLSADLDE